MRRLYRFFKHSLPARLLVIFLGVGFGMILILSFAFSMGLRDQWRNNIRPHMVQYLDYVRADIGDPPDLQRAQELARRLPINIYITGPDINYTSTGRPLELTDLEFDNDEHRDRRQRWPASVRVGELDNRTVLRAQAGDYQIYYELRRRGDRPHKHWVFLCALLALCGFLWLCYRLIRHQLRPVYDIQHGVGLMGQGDLSHKIAVRRDDDLGDLATSINTMAGDIEQMLDAKRQLLLGISHELRSPLTRARVSTELLDESNHRGRILEDLLEMESLITDILESERLNSRHGVLSRSPFDLIELIKQVVAEGHFDPVDLKLDASSLLVNLDEARVRLLLRNLIGNAIRHGGQAASPVTVSLRSNNTGVTIVVKDEGPGIAPDDLARLTEPFYRADPSRSRHTGGFGLGLYLCRLICEAHDGELTIESPQGEGTRVIAALSTL